MVAIVVAQEFQWVFSATQRDRRTPVAVHFAFDKAERRVASTTSTSSTPTSGPGFIKICTYFPYPAKVWVNGHEWAKRQADQPASASPSWPTGSPPATTPTRCRRSATASARPTCRRSSTAGSTFIPTPFTGADRAAGYWWELSMRQVEVSRTLVFDDPRRARGFFEALVADNSASADPTRSRSCSTARCARTDQGPVPHPGRHPRHRGQIDFRYKHCRIKEYLKEGRALRIETVVNAPNDLGVQARLENLPELQAKARAANRRLLISNVPARAVPSTRAL